MIKILHTSDLHIGKRLYQEELAEDLQLFFNWMTDLIEKEKIDVLVVSGDIFDVANPSGESRKVYFGLLVKISRLNCKVIITAGNHDSPLTLEAPKELLKELNIHVIGSLPDNSGEMLIPVRGSQGKTEIVIAAVPYLREADLRKHSEGETATDRAEAIRNGIVRIFAEAAAECEMKYPGIPAIAMGHLYVQGSGVSESEREIQIGNMAGIDATTLTNFFKYYALGHLHQPQDPVEGKIVYSGAPVKMSFSESENQNRIILLNAEVERITAAAVPVPHFRKLVRLTGTVEQLDKNLKDLPEEETALKTFIELDAVEENPDPAKINELQVMSDGFGSRSAKILKSKIRFINQPAGTASLYDVNINIEDLKPEDVFIKKIENENIDGDTAEMLKEAFMELLEEVQQNMEER
jgi:exonuclease SbcD